MKISIVTACYNSAATIQDTLRTIQMQTHQDIEHIVIDGGSTDGTLELLEQNKSHIAFLSSEPDDGLYHAMNKGILKATGDVIGLLNSDDLFASKTALSRVANALSDPLIDACYGDLVYVQHDDINRVARYWKSSPYAPQRFAKGWIPAHPTFYVKKRIHDQHGMLFNLDYQLASDYDVLFRLLHQHGIRTAYIPEVLVKMRLGGATNQSIQHIIKQNQEIMRILTRHGYSYSPIRLMCSKLIDRCQQYLNKGQYA